METKEHDDTIAAMATRLAKIECDLIEVKHNIKIVLHQGATKSDLIETGGDIQVSVSKSKSTILMVIATFMILVNAIYPIIHACN